MAKKKAEAPAMPDYSYDPNSGAHPQPGGAAVLTDIINAEPVIEDDDIAFDAAVADEHTEDDVPEPVAEPQAEAPVEAPAEAEPMET